MSRRELAETVQFNPQTIGYLERGDYKPSLQLAMKIANVFGVPVELAFSLTPFPSVTDTLRRAGSAMSEKTFLMRLDDVVRWPGTKIFGKRGPSRSPLRWASTIALLFSFVGFIMLFVWRSRQWAVFLLLIIGNGLARIIHRTVCLGVASVA